MGVPGQRAADLARLSARLQASTDGSPLLDLVVVMTDLKDSTRTRLVLKPGGPQLEQEQYTDPAGQRIRDLSVGYITQVYQ